MKKIIMLITIIVSSYGILYSQWAPAGACWHYNFSGFAINGYYKINCIGDTVINNISCKVLEKKIYQYNHLGSQFDTITLEHEYTYADLNKVYICRYNTFYTLYDFSANIGDTIIVAGTNKYSSAGCDSTGAIKIDSVGTMNINGETLRYISVSPTATSKWGWYARIVEKIGPVYEYQNNPEYNYLFPVKLDYCGMQLDELSEGGFLRCYTEPNGFTYKQLGTAPDCEYINTGISELNDAFSELKVSPNPTNGIINLSYKLRKPQSIQIDFSDAMGKLIFSDNIPESEAYTKEYHLENMLPGIYIIKLKSGNNAIVKKNIKY